MKKKLYNKSEKITHEILEKLSQRWGFTICPKIRVADVLDIDKVSINSELRKYALMAHFDFTIYDNDDNPIFSIEFDGYYHKYDKKQKERDNKKNRLCELFNYPLLRVTYDFFKKKSNSMNLLAYFVNYWFVDKMIENAYKERIIPLNDYTDPSFWVTSDGISEQFPLWLSQKARCNIEKFYKKNLCIDSVPSCYIGSNQNYSYFAISCLRIDEKYGIFVERSMLGQLFPQNAICEALEGITINELYNKLRNVLSREINPSPLAVIKKKLGIFLKTYRILSIRAGGFPPIL